MRSRLNILGDFNSPLFNLFYLKINIMTSSAWTREENEYLQEWAEFLPVEQIAKKLKKSVNAVWNRAKEEKLNLKPIYDNWSTHELARLLELSHETVRVWVKKGELKASQSRKIKGSVWRISKESFKSFYLKYRGQKYCFKRVNQENLEWILNG